MPPAAVGINDVSMVLGMGLARNEVKGMKKMACHCMAAPTSRRRPQN